MRPQQPRIGGLDQHGLSVVLLNLANDANGLSAYCDSMEELIIGVGLSIFADFLCLR